jgi:uncharacterized membrane protein HdeD (DUF308 family)
MNEAPQGEGYVQLSRSGSLVVIAMGLATAAVGLGAGLLPLAAPAYGGHWIGWSLVLAAIFELVAGAVKRSERGRYGRMAAGAITLVAGLLFIANPLVELFPIVFIIVAWLVARGVLLLVASYRSRNPFRGMTALAAVGDLLLAAILVSGLPAAGFVASVFGPTPALVQSFGWVFAASFFVTGVSLAFEPLIRMGSAGSKKRRQE